MCGIAGIASLNEDVSVEYLPYLISTQEARKSGMYLNILIKLRNVREEQHLSYNANPGEQKLLTSS